MTREEADREAKESLRRATVDDPIVAIVYVAAVAVYGCGVFAGWW
jgi:hypothetical protein